jgi:hypothetical protein
VVKRSAIAWVTVACLTFGVAACSSDDDTGSEATSDTTVRNDTAGPASTTACQKLDPALLAAAIPGSTFTFDAAADLPLTANNGAVLVEHGADCSFTVSGVDVWTEARVGIYSVPEGSTAAELVVDAVGDGAGGCDAPPIGETSGFTNGLGYAAQADVVVTASFPGPGDADGTDLSAGSPHDTCALVVSLLEAATPLGAG